MEKKTTTNRQQCFFDEIFNIFSRAIENEQQKRTAGTVPSRLKRQRRINKNLVNDLTRLYAKSWQLSRR